MGPLGAGHGLTMGDQTASDQASDPWAEWPVGQGAGTENPGSGTRTWNADLERGPRIETHQGHFVGT